MKISSTMFLAFALACTSSPAVAQPPGGRGRDSGRQRVSPFDRLMTMDSNGDGNLTTDEVTDARLKMLFKRADADKDGVVTKEELAALVSQQAGTDNAGSRGFGGGPDRDFGPGRDGGMPGGPMQGGPMHGGPMHGGPGAGFSGPGGNGPFGPPQIGQILPAFIQEDLGLTEKQRAAIAKLQKTVDAQLAKILTTEQQQQLSSGPGGPGHAGPGHDRRQGRPPMDQ